MVETLASNLKIDKNSIQLAREIKRVIGIFDGLQFNEIFKGVAKLKHSAKLHESQLQNKKFFQVYVKLSIQQATDEDLEILLTQII